jgi:hypothetical protein
MSGDFKRPASIVSADRERRRKIYAMRDMLLALAEYTVQGKDKGLISHEVAQELLKWVQKQGVNLFDAEIDLIFNRALSPQSYPPEVVSNDLFFLDTEVELDTDQESIQKLQAYLEGLTVHPANQISTDASERLKKYIH